MQFFFCIKITCTVNCCKDTDPTLQEGLAAVKNGLPIFSYRFINEPPDGMLLKIDIHEKKNKSPCKLYAIDGDVAGAAPFWFLILRTGSAIPGIYDIIPFWDETENRDKAQALLSYAEDGIHMSRYEAIGGSIEIITAPQSIGEWNAAIPLKAKVTVLFPKKAMLTVECNGACMDVDGEAVNCYETCICEDPNGNRRTCELTTLGVDTCCLDLTGETIEYLAEFTAEPCPEMCDWLAGQSQGRYCQQLY